MGPPGGEDELRRISPAAGSFDRIAVEDGELRVHGWMLLPGSGPFDSIRVIAGRVETGLALREAREDVGSALPWIRRASASGFSVRLPVGPERVDLIGNRRGRPVARHSALLPAPVEAVEPPPVELAERVSGTSGEPFVAQGLCGAASVLDVVERHTSLPSVSRVLDWGCGCGRLTRHLLGRFPRVDGCDIDAEAIGWCRQHLEPARFQHVAPDPQTAYEDAAFDLIVAGSVFTHLSRERQLGWLAELGRILATGGLLVASVHGEFSYRLAYGRHGGGRTSRLLARARARRLSRELTRERIIDAQLDRRLDGIAPPGYYRSTYQSRSYTLDAWSEHFELLEYVELGLMGHQDLVVMRAR
jgi:SAM-dependent methyltransferase